MYDFVQLLRDYSIPFDETVNKGWINIKCPLCSDKSHHGGFNTIGDYYNCFRCGKHSLQYVIGLLLSVNKYKAEEILQEYSGRLSITASINKRESKVSKIILPGNGLEEMHRNYLLKRKFDPDYLVQKYKIQGTGITGEWKFRIMIPIFYQERLVSYQGRDITGKAKLRYKTLSIEESIIDPKDLLYNMDNAKKEKVILVEGVFDVFRMGDNTVATLGTGMKPAQRLLLNKTYKEVVFLFDPEKEAQDRAKQQAEQLASMGMKVEIFELDGENDPAQLTEKEVIEIKKEIGV